MVLNQLLEVAEVVLVVGSVIKLLTSSIECYYKLTTLCIHVYLGFKRQFWSAINRFSGFWINLD